MEEATLREGEEPGRGLARAPPRPREPGGGGAEGDAEALVPPTAPEAGEPPVKDVVGEAAEEGRVVPQVGSATQERPQREGANEHPQLHNHGDGGEHAGGGEERAVEKQLPWRQGGEEGREWDWDGGLGILRA